MSNETLNITKSNLWWTTYKACEEVKYVVHQ